MLRVVDALLDVIGGLTTAERSKAPRQEKAPNPQPAPRPAPMSVCPGHPA